MLLTAFLNICAARCVVLFLCQIADDRSLVLEGNKMTFQEICNSRRAKKKVHAQFQGTTYLARL